jgi:hypothetical protein
MICNGEMRLNDLPAGPYTFELNVTDGASNASVTERTPDHFRVTLKWRIAGSTVTPGTGFSIE